MYIFQVERYLLERQIRAYAPELHGDVLDVGAGGSRYRHLITAKKYTTLDIAPGEGIDVVGDAVKLPFATGSFDGIISTQVLGDVSDPGKAIKEFFRVLRPHGTLLLTESFMNELHDEPNDYWRFTKFGFEKLFRDAGFRHITSDQRGGFFAVLAQEMIRYCIDRFSLYQKPFLGKGASLLFKSIGRTALWLDSIDRSATNKKHALGWCVVAKKE